MLDLCWAAALLIEEQWFLNRLSSCISTQLANVWCFLISHVQIQCPSCQFVWCFKCHSPWHEGVNCKEYKKGDKLLRHWANEIEHGQRNAQKCPKCKVSCSPLACR